MTRLQQHSREGGRNGLSSSQFPRLFVWFLVADLVLFSLIPIFLYNEPKVPLRAARKLLLDNFQLLGVETPAVEGDSWKPMTTALQRFQINPGTSLYEEIFFKEKQKFQYPPSSLLLLELLQQFVGLGRAVVIFRLASFLITCLSGLVCAAILVVVSIRQGLVKSWSTEAAALFVLGLFSATLFYPILFGALLGQIQPWISCLFAVATLCAILGKWRYVGISCGLACAIKPQFLLYVLWFVIRKERLAFTSMCVTVGSIEALAIWRYGWENHLGYLDVLSYIARHGEAFHANQSVNGLINRALFLGDNLVFAPNSFPPYSPIVFALTLLSSLLILLFALYPHKSDRLQGRLYDFLLAGLAFTMASPIAWDHHYGICLAIFAAMLPVAIAHGRTLVIELMVCFIPIANFLSFTLRYAATHMNWVQSNMLFAGVLLMFVLHRYRNMPEPETAHSQGAVKLAWRKSDN